MIPFYVMNLLFFGEPHTANTRLSIPFLQLSINLLDNSLCSSDNLYSKNIGAFLGKDSTRLASSPLKDTHLRQYDLPFSTPIECGSSLPHIGHL